MPKNAKCRDCGSPMFCFEGGPDRERHHHQIGGIRCLKNRLTAALAANADLLAACQKVIEGDWLADEEATTPDGDSPVRDQVVAAIAKAEAAK